MITSGFTFDHRVPTPPEGSADLADGLRGHSLHDAGVNPAAVTI
ncbi:MAG: hypothetical protein ACOYXM_04505 [Actinomycetota bacterium]